MITLTTNFNHLTEREKDVYEKHAPDKRKVIFYNQPAPRRGMLG
jgi:hypothetical protein